jgi:hypothetical protein
VLKAALQTQLAAMKEYFDRSTRVLEEKDSNYRPVTGMLTAAQQIAHAAQTVEWFVGGAFAAAGFDMDFERMDKEVRAVTSIAAARAWMDRACDKAKSAIESHLEADWNAQFPPNPIHGRGAEIRSLLCLSRSHCTPPRRTDGVFAPPRIRAADALHGNVNFQETVTGSSCVHSRREGRPHPASWQLSRPNSATELFMECCVTFRYAAYVKVPGGYAYVASADSEARTPLRFQ